MDEKSGVVITLRWPPSVNHYWRRCRDRVYVSKEGSDYRMSAAIICHEHKAYFDKDESIKMVIEAYPPDNRRRDLDNILKSLLDSLQYAGVYVDDNQIDELHVLRCKPNHGKVVISLSQLPRNVII